MTPEQKRVVKSTILECRKILEADIEQVLINYGIYIDSPWVNVKLLQNLTEEDENIRKKIEEVIKKLEKSGLTTAESVKQYIKEIVYTYINRLSALRVLEVRGLIEEVLIPRKQWGDRSYGHLRFYEVARDYCKYQSDTGLAYFIHLIFGEISEEIRVLFNTDDEYSLINPSSEALISVVDLLCNQIEENSWKQDEIIGWIYQYFNEKEKDDVFDRLYSKKQKIKASDIPAATQLFTPNWIVKWIVDNSLGVLWNEIKEGKRAGKKLEEIRLLDPACGSGHFLVQAYDLFYNFYLSEGYDKEKVPFLILQNNLFGIDIDLRAIQLTALVLFIKVKVSLKESGFDTNTKDKISINLVCADAVLLNGTRLERLKNQFKKNPTISIMIDIIYEEFKDTRLKGSLIQPEKRLYPLFEEYKDKIAIKEFKKLKKIKKSNQEALVEMLDADTLEEYKSKRNWSKEEEELLGFLDLVYKEAIRANDISQQMFANEAVKSVKLVDIFMNEYDVVITNPPYMGKTNMNESLKNFIKKLYKDFDNDLYSAFIKRCYDFLDTGGKLGMITQESFLFISSYSKFRSFLLQNSSINSLVHLGPHAFDDISGEKVSTCMFVLSKQIPDEETYGVYIKLNDINSSEGKKESLLKNSHTDENRYFIVKQKFFSSLTDSPFIYWISDKLKSILSNNSPLVEYAVAKTGINTGCNDVFVKYWWEIFSTCNRNFVPYAKGGGAVQFLGAQQCMVWWKPEEMKKYPGCRLMNQELFYKEGLTFSGVNSQRFAVRYLPVGFIFDSGGSFINVTNTDIYYLLGFLNTEIANYYLNLFNPTINFKNNDIHRLPYIFKDSIKDQVIQNVMEIMKAKSNILKFDETDKEFKLSIICEIKPFSIEESIILLDRFKLQYYELVDKNNEYFYEIYDFSKDDINLIEKENKSCSVTDIIKSLNESTDIELVAKKLDVKESYILKVKLENKVQTSQEKYNHVFDLISYYIGCLFNRWNLNGLEPDDDGILPIDSSIYVDDIVHRIYECIGLTFGEENVDIIVQDIEQIIGVRLDDWFMRDFFKEHIVKYQKRPIYWHICSPKKTFNCFVYYHKLDHDSLYKVKGIYLAEMINRYKEDLSYYREQMLKARDSKDNAKENDFKNRCNELELKLDDLNKLNKEIDKILPYSPDIDEGVLKNIMPLEPILSATVSNDKEREDSIEEDEEE